MVPPMNPRPLGASPLPTNSVRRKRRNLDRSLKKTSDNKEKKHRKPKPALSHKIKHVSDTLVAADVQATALAAPIPAAGSSSSGSTLTVTLPPTATPVFIDPSITRIITSEPSSFARKTTTVWVTPSSATEVAAAETHTSNSSASPSTPGHLPIFVFALIAVGATCFGLGVLLVLRNLCIRRTYTERVRPSAPIMQESPLFGGKERLSGRLWADQSFANMRGTLNKNGSYAGKGPGWRPLSGGNASDLTKVNEKAYLSAVSPFADPSPKPSEIPLSPASVYTQAAPTTIGVAVDYPLPPPPIFHTEKPTQPLKVKDKPVGRSNSKNSVKRQSGASTMYGGIEIGSPTSMADTRMPTGSAYQTPRPAPSPAAPTTGKSKPTLKPAGSSRDRIQPPRYEQGGPASNARRLSYARSAAKDEPFVHAIPMTKSQERRDRDTKALTSALGLSSPPQPPPSSCFSPASLYPDDSLSVAYGLGGGGTRPPSEMPSPTGTHAALGDLMLQDFPSVATFASLKLADPFAGEAGFGKAKKGGGQTRNGPPRVPSPPPLPSLAQMALENADPDYRSPTYSLYGFYEAQRKSKSSMGGER